MNILHFKDVDRIPAVHFGYWSELVVEWAEQGKIPMEIALKRGDSNAYDKELDRIIGWDFNWHNVKDFANINLMPQFEQKVLETLPDGSQRVQSVTGVIERVKPGIISIPSEDDYLLKDRDAFEEFYKPKMQFDKKRIREEVIKSFNETRPYDVPVGIRAGSVLGKIRDMTTVVGMSYLMYDDEDLFAEIIDTYADMQYECIKTALEAGVKCDFAHVWEDICFKNGPLISPEIFDELCGKHYKKRTDLLKKHGIDVISLDCDGVTDRLLPTWVENGVNTMFPIEIGVWGDQFEAARKKYGREILGVGGMDKTAFRKDKAAVDAEIERLKRLVELGGFIPCPDHRLMPGSKFELVQYYAEEIKKIRI